MIDQALGLLLDRLNAFLSERFPEGGPHAVLSSDFDRGDAPTSGDPASIAIAVVKIDRGQARSRAIGLRPGPAQAVQPSPFLDLGLLLLVSGRFGPDERAGWRMLSAALEFFHMTPVLSSELGAADAASIGTVEIVPFDASLEDLAAIWSIRGARYRPGFLLAARLTPAPARPA
jgi:hypothetical protein